MESSIQAVVRFLLGLALLGQSLLAGAQAGSAVPDFYKEPGLYPTRSYLNQNFAEHIDPFTGILQHHYVDIFIPGPGGMDLKVQRSYSAIQDRVDYSSPDALGYPSFAGVGWTMHFGRVLKSDTNFCTPGTTTSSNPVLELPDGSRRILFPATGVNALYITIDRWKADCSAGNLIVRSPEGIEYDMTFSSIAGTANALNATRIVDRNNNSISIFYTYAVFQVALITSVSASDGRSLSYSYSGGSPTAVPHLDSIYASSGVTYYYGYTRVYDPTYPGLANYYQLTSVVRPDGLGWYYGYNGRLSAGQAGSFCMQYVHHPQGGAINYTYGYVAFDASSPTIQNTVVRGKSTSDGGGWTFSYLPGSVNDVTTVSGPASTSYTYRHFGYGAAGNGSAWKIGLLLSKSVGSTQNESYSWTSQTISNQVYQRGSLYPTKSDSTVQAPVMTNHTISRDGAGYSTTYSGFDTYGNPGSKVESGQSSLSWSLSYYIDTGKWIVHQARDETSSGPSVTRLFDGNGNVFVETRNGLTTFYGHYSSGDVSSVTDAANHRTDYGSYFRGVPGAEYRPEGVTIHRGISSAGNVDYGIDGEGYRTSYAYDGVNRITGVTFPFGSPVSISYYPTSRTLTRGSYSETTVNDGFGRPTQVTREGIATKLAYDALGRKTFESYANGVTQGMHFSHDVLGRVTAVRYDGGGIRNISYSVGQITVTDERSNATTYGYRAYGNPDDKVLTSITTPEPGTSIVIGRDAFGSITSVRQGSAVTRNYVYNASHFLVSETNPETGTTLYGRDAVGNMTSRRVGASGQTLYGYDQLNRLSTINYPSGTTPNAAFLYNRNSKLVRAANGVAVRTFGYDANNNLTSETTTIDGLTFTTAYAYDSLDHLRTLTYPRTGKVITYSPDALGRPTQALPYVSGISYYANGQPLAMTYQNSVTVNYGQNARGWPSSVAHRSKGIYITNTSYGYDNAGNLQSIADSADITNNRALGYDRINRLTSALGSWGSSTIAYDGVGNITRQTGSLLTYVYLGNNTLGTVTGGGPTRTYSYDAYGDVTGDGTHTFDYDDAQALRCVDCLAGAAIHFDYDAKNMRIRKTKGVAKTYSIYSAKGDLLTEYDPFANTYLEYVYVNGKQIAKRFEAPKAPTTTQLAASPNPARVGMTVTLDAMVTGSNPGGTITFYDGATILGTGSLASGHATWSGSFATAAVHTLTASYAGDANNGASVSAPVSEIINVGWTTTTNLSASRYSAPFGTPITFTAFVTNGRGVAVTGPVTFYAGATPIGSATVAATGFATFSTSTLAVGSHSITASYAGDADNKPSTSTAVSETITRAATTTALASSQNPANLGTSVTFQATVSGGTGMTGSITFYDGATPLSTVSLISGSASMSTSSLALGAHSITAKYTGDPDFLPSQSSPLIETVNVAVSSTTLTASPGSIYGGQSIAMTATVTGFSPTGTVTFFDGTTPLGTAALSFGVGTYTTTGLRIGDRLLHASYAGDGNNGPSTSAILGVTVAPNVAVYRPTSSTFFVDYNQDHVADVGVGFGGVAGDVGLIGDVLGTGKDSFVIFRNGLWYVSTNWDGTANVTYGFGGAGDIPLLADMNGDGKADLVVFRGGVWYVSNTRTGVVSDTYYFGGPGDVPLIADMNGDGVNDLVIYRNGIWYASYARNGTVGDTFYFGGLAQDKPMAFKWDTAYPYADLILFRDGQWLISTRRDGTVQTSFGYGGPGDIPLLGIMR